MWILDDKSFCVEIICIEETAYFAVLDKVIAYVKDKHEIKQDQWISGTEAMAMLRIKSKTTLQKLSDEGQIRYSQPEKKIILYDADSIRAYLDDFVNETF